MLAPPPAPAPAPLPTPELAPLPSTQDRQNLQCPACAGPMVEKRNRRNGGKFYGCVTWPACDGTRQYADPTKSNLGPRNQAGSGGHTQRAAATLEACAMDPTAAADSAKQGSAQRSLATLGACAPDPTAAADSANQAGSGSHPQTLDPMAAAESANPAGSAGPVDFVEQLLEQIGAQPSSSVMDSFLPPGLVEDDQDRIAATMKADLSLLSLIYLYYGLFIFYLFFLYFLIFHPRVSASFRDF